MTKMDSLGIEPRASRMLSGCDTTTPTAQLMTLLFVHPLIGFRRASAVGLRSESGLVATSIGDAASWRSASWRQMCSRTA